MEAFARSIEVQAGQDAIILVVQSFVRVGRAMEPASDYLLANVLAG